jgi:hypothetical protein
MEHYTYLQTSESKRNKRILYLGFAFVFLALQGVFYNPFEIPLIITGNICILISSIETKNKEMILLTLLMMTAQLTRLL